MSCIRTTFSRIFDKKKKEDSRRGDSFHLVGIKVLNSDGTSPDRSDLFMMLVRAGRRRSMFRGEVLLAVGQVRRFSVRFS